MSRVDEYSNEPTASGAVRELPAGVPSTAYRQLLIPFASEARAFTSTEAWKNFPDAGDRIETEGEPLSTVTRTAAAVAARPCASLTLADTVREPAAAVVVSHWIVYGAVATGAPRFAPSRV